MPVLRRPMVGLFALALVIGALQGCGGGSLQEGIPEDVDMTKHYAPAAAAEPFNPQQMQKDSTAPRATTP